MATSKKDISASHKTKVASREQVFGLLRQHRAEITGFGVAKIGLFGSFVRGEQKEASDVDVLVQFEPDKKTYKNFIRLAYFLEDLFNRKTELVTLESLSPFLKPHILKEVSYVSFAD
ncbi:MAG: nucleotidyltransferase [Bacteroidetes bacterium]|nr:nucleotidyltransferase [Bacteroidota bacterium]